MVALEPYISTIQDMMEDESIPRFSTNLAFFTRSKNSQEIESKIIYSILRTHQPKKAERYFFLNIVNHEDPYTFEYQIEEILPNKIFRVSFILGFKIQISIHDYFLQVLDDMISDQIIPNKSYYPSLRKHNIPPDLLYIILDNVYINQYFLTVKEQIVMNVYHVVRKLGSSDFTVYGLASHNVKVESTPLLYDPALVHKIKQTGFKRLN